MRLRNHWTVCWECGGAIDCTGRFCRACNLARYLGSGRLQAMAAVAKAIREGRLPKPATARCVDCGAAAREYDHRDYSRPLDVQPVCRICNVRRGPGKWVKFTPVREMRIAV